MMNMQYELAHERAGDVQRAALRTRDATRLASATRWRRLEHVVAAAHERVARSAEAADELSHTQE
jgi:hypothetical protein